jgi:two-component system cell cycle response regulator DivK
MGGSMEKKTILYIEDSGVDRELIRRLLEGDGFNVLVTGNPDSGIEMAQSKIPDLILIDLHLPEMDGSMIAGILREMPQLGRVPIVALSASIREEEREDMLGHFDGFLEKPVNLETFPKSVIDFIQKGRSYRPEPKVSEKKVEAIDISEETREVLESLEKVRAAMSHDLRTPLTVMISYANTVGREKVGSLNEQQKEMLDLVVDQGFQMDALISELVRIAKQTLARYSYPPK